MKMELEQAIKEYDEIVVLKGNSVVTPELTDYSKVGEVFVLTPCTMAIKIGG